MTPPAPAAKAAPAPAAKAAPAPLAPASAAPASAAPASAAPAAPKLPPLSPAELAPDGDAGAILSADHRDPFAFLGLHSVQPSGRLVLRAFLPQAKSVAVVDRATGEVVATLERVREEGLFAAAIDGRSAPFAYRLRLETANGRIDIDDPYRFPPVLSDEDVQLLAEGDHFRSYDMLGAHPLTLDGVAGLAFAVWAPNAVRVSVIASFNDWDGRRHGMRLRHDCGVWEIFIPGVGAGELYKYEIKTPTGVRLPDKCDPYAFFVEPSPGSAAIACDLSRHAWRDREWMQKRSMEDPRRRPISVYQLHIGSWRRRPEDGNRPLTYRELADEAVGYLDYMAFTHVELLPINEFDFDASLGFQPFVPYAPTSRWGTPADLQYFVDRCHQVGIGVILDWVPNHFSDDPHGLRSFDGTHLYEHPDPQRRKHPATNTLNYDYGRREVSNYLISNALFWMEHYHIDGLCVSSLPAMLYLDYGRHRGEWTANRFGGHENLEAVDFLRRLNEKAYERYKGIFTIGEDNSGWQRLSHPTFLGGLGFGFRWNLDWKRDTLRYMSRNPVHRKYYHDELIHGATKVFDENAILPLSYTDVAYGRGSMLHKMPGDRWQRFANLRAYYGFFYGHPGKKLLFMGDEFAQEREWNSDISLDWHVAGEPLHGGIQSLVRDLNHLYRSAKALHELDCEADGFSWIDCNDADQGVVSFVRQSRDGSGTVVVVAHFTPVARRNYRVGVPVPGFYAERVNTDSEKYGGANIGNEGGVTTVDEPMHGRPYALSLTLPPLATVILEHVGERP
ncbi:1,4-alpha-glucan branching enzyme GlgB [uncultured Defluviicoccus sp.]|uniref:1,4-alpha-glucan branching enzyme n=1 Tax=metagenome TaxID=256318 RepID=A0A380TD36_9ZZZZ|nr:1,4-alpha-glucan branching enzyme GlgB [uncultured Defluviicoccus sp.]